VEFLKRLTRLIDVINEWVGKSLAYLILPIFVLMMVEVFRRYVLNSPTVWGTELTQMMFAVYVILSGGYILSVGGHVNVDIITSRASARTRAILDIFTSSLFFLFVGFLFYYGGSLAMESVRIMETSQSAWDVPIYPIKLMIPVGAGLLLLQGFAKLLRDILLAVTGEDVLGGHVQERETV